MPQPALEAPDVTAPIPRTAAQVRRNSAPRLGVAALGVFAAVPFALALLAAVRAPKMHVLLDYWHVFAKITDDTGHLLLGQVFTYHLDQPFVVPSLLFYADAAWFGGDNRVLTVLTIALLAVIVVTLRTMLPRQLSPATRAALTAALSWLLFTSHATELWLQGTNGISWVPAVTACTIAIACAHHGRPVGAAVAAVLGCLSFGAALPIWFVLAVIAWLRRESRVRIVIPAAAGLVILAAWWLTKPAGTQSGATDAFDPDGRLSVLAAAVGGLWSVDIAVLAVVAGGLTVALLALLLRHTVIDRPAATDAGWAGLACYAVLLAFMLALGRTTTDVPGGNVGLISRYVLIAALATVALLVLATVHRPQWPTRYLVTAVVALSLVTHAIGGGKADEARRSYAPLALSAIALRVDAPAALEALHIQRAAGPAARALGAYPFNDGFTLGCHGPELGSRLDLATAPPASAGALDAPATDAGGITTGWAVVNGTRPDCILITDGTGTVTGGGITGLPLTPGQTPKAAPGATAWQATAGPTNGPSAVLAVQGGHLYRIG
ncbi:hypothetical protein AMES_1987 [Amycolatopsis mediterranei S699]|uniref:DUF2079 domain-containing protein n=2 Tax=Amycolatopsis mediterranei TaxID=33910 RepID=A0A0H3D0G2_AMYMU|nr:hypothetical protein [Amycolatopsis mediterranei]ADJ43810.1 conserved hypothetical protein [Amycolatopsis mediterranei U32]AEK40522.1 hypothetical protein RAM_10160 [Amycolatopsis mediterranei S699]AFO75523.1 hypothetical protein AMES_1987 [Amycolatopsis mediterranei S699]AGT82652.1 hypothetical protein B737_1988 [Amycolatopsis mediterranei RB]KDO09183.1 hypothetical protein DV26_19675 [Amycolatopsis mediterranei]